MYRAGNLAGSGGTLNAAHRLDAGILKGEAAVDLVEVRDPGDRILLRDLLLGNHQSTVGFVRHRGLPAADDSAILSHQNSRRREMRTRAVTELGADDRTLLDTGKAAPILLGVTHSPARRSAVS
jgi:hypothetical protein